MKKAPGLRGSSYLALGSVLLVVAALVAGMAACGNGAPARYSLTLEANPEEGGTAVDLTGASPYEEGAPVSIKAEAAEGYRFVGWTAPEGSFSDPGAAETTFTMPDSDVTVTANFHRTARPTRELPDEVSAGEEFEVTVTFTSPHDQFHAIGLTDMTPEGWSVVVDKAWATPVAMEAHTPEPEEAVYIWAGPFDAGTEFTVTYRVQVPVDASSGTYTFAGVLEYYIQPHPSPSHEEDITGDMQVTVG